MAVEDPIGTVRKFHNRYQDIGDQGSVYIKANADTWVSLNGYLWDREKPQGVSTFPDSTFPTDSDYKIIGQCVGTPVNIPPELRADG